MVIGYLHVAGRHYRHNAMLMWIGAQFTWQKYPRSWNMIGITQTPDFAEGLTISTTTWEED
jgi:hypothetical protein